MSISSNLTRADHRFLSQAADPELRKREIARLTRYRRTVHSFIALFLLLCVAFSLLFLLIGIASHGPVSRHDLYVSLSALVSMVMVTLIQLLVFVETQNKLRLLLLAGQNDARQNRSGI